MMLARVVVAFIIVAIVASAKQSRKERKAAALLHQLIGKSLFVPGASQQDSTNADTGVAKRTNSKSMKNGLQQQHHRDASTHILMESSKVNADHIKGIKKLRKSDANAKHQVTFAVKKLNMDRIHDIALDVSLPNSSNYGNHWSRDELVELYGNMESTKFIKQYLKEFDSSIVIVSATQYGDFITASASVKVWEKLFSTSFNHYASDNGYQYHRCDTYSLPHELVSHVHVVMDTIQKPPTARTVYSTSEAFKDLKPVKSHFKKGSRSLHDESLLTANHLVYPELINDFYNVDSNTGSALASQAVYSSIGQSFSTLDLSNFFDYFDIPARTMSYSTSHQTKYCRDVNDCIEANLDTQYMMGISQNTDTSFWYSKGNHWTTWLANVQNQANPPDVFSISYGEPEFYMTKGEVQVFEDNAAILAAMGVTLVASSGDDGAVGLAEDALTCDYFPDWPASSPYITSVGATQGPEQGNPEITCNGYTGGIVTSGGGFSNFFPRPSWQDDAISTYFASSTPATGYNAAGRGYPDVALLGYNYLIAAGSTDLNSIFTSVSGTSASSPVFGAFVSLVNAARLDAGKGKLGWINPAMYAAYKDSADWTNDITSGNNNCKAFGVLCCEQGFTATAGWDPSTGLGSVDFKKFKATMMALGNNLNVPTTDPTVAPKKPTIEPTLKPTNVPTTKPTSSPTLGRGYFSISTYADGDTCDGVVQTQSTYASGTCLIAYTTDKKKAGSMNFVCSQDGMQVQVFSDNKCAKMVDTANYTTGCSISADLSSYYSNYGYYGYYGDDYGYSYGDYDDGYADDWNYYYYNTDDNPYTREYNFTYIPTKVSCTDDVTALPLSTDGQSYVLAQFFDTTSADTCTTDTLSYYEAYIADICISLGYYSVILKLKNGIPYVHFYSGTTCSGKSYYNRELSTTCAEKSSYYYYSPPTTQLFESYNTYPYIPTNNPTATPTKAANSDSTSSNGSPSGISNTGKAAVGAVVGIVGFGVMAFVGYYYYSKSVSAGASTITTSTAVTGDVVLSPVNSAL